MDRGAVGSVLVSGEIFVLPRARFTEGDFGAIKQEIMLLEQMAIQTGGFLGHPVAIIQQRPPREGHGGPAAAVAAAASETASSTSAASTVGGPAAAGSTSGGTAGAGPTVQILGFRFRDEAQTRQMMGLHRDMERDLRVALNKRWSCGGIIARHQILRSERTAPAQDLEHGRGLIIAFDWALARTCG